MLVVVQHFGVKTRLIEQAVLVLRVLVLRNSILFQSFLRLADEPETITQIRPDVGIVCTSRDRFLVMIDRMRPVLPIVVPIGQGFRGVRSRQIRDVRWSGLR